jgi:hypothetical protein
LGESGSKTQEGGAGGEELVQHGWGGMMVRREVEEASDLDMLEDAASA